MRRVLVALGLVLVPLTVAAVATAGKPDKFFLPTDDTVLHGPCTFDVGYDVLANKEYGKVFAENTLTINGSFKVRLTNLTSRKAMDVNVSGPGVITFYENGNLGVVARGNWIFYFNPGMFGPGSPGRLLLTSGHGTELLDASNNVLDWSPPNKVTDACALLS